MSRVLLVVPPFHQIFIPAIGVSLLKAALARRDIPCDIFYLNIPFGEQIGPELYTEIASEGRFCALAGDWVFASDLFGDLCPDPGSYVDQVLLRQFGDVYDAAFAERLTELRTWAPRFMDSIMERIPWTDYEIVGVSSTYQQNASGLSLLKRLKARYPHVATAMGGANCEGQMGAAIHDLFPFVDYVCSGEGDQIVPELFRRILAGEPTRGLPGIFARGERSLIGDATHTPLVMEMDALPYPDYDDYFAQFEASSLGSVEVPTLALETSRGCWWGQKHHCTFCGLNGGGLEYRSKSPARAIGEIDFLIDRYPSRKIYAIDNILDRGYLSTVLQELAERPRPPRLFYETKANLTKPELRTLARAGVWGIQPGIESLSTPILRLMEKGITGIQNVRLLKWCAEIGLNAEWNLLCGFPGEDPAEYEQIADLVPSLTHLQPPAGMGQIRLDRFSPYFATPEARGMTNLRASLAYEHVYPFSIEELNRLAYYFDYDYVDGRKPLAYAATLRTAIAEWQEQHVAARLELIDDGAQIEMSDTRPAAPRPMTILTGAQRVAYLALDGAANLDTVVEAVHAAGSSDPVDRSDVVSWLDLWLAERLIMREGARYLSLAVNPAERVQMPVDRFLAQLTSDAP